MACAGKQIIKQSSRHEITITSTEVSEGEMNRFCSHAVYMEACIVIRKSEYRSFRCPHLLELRSCNPRKPAITIIDNPRLEVVDINMSVKYEWNQKILRIRHNPALSFTVIARLKRICPQCDIDGITSKCIGLSNVGNVEAFIERCAGEPIITGRLDIKQPLSGLQITRLFSRAREVQMCITLIGTHIRSLVFPKLTHWRSCSRDKPALVLRNNRMLTNLRFPSCTRHGCLESAVITGNPLIPVEQMKLVSRWCTNCVYLLQNRHSRVPTTRWLVSPTMGTMDMPGELLQTLLSLRTTLCLSKLELISRC
ncbi:hypothetical protein COOONC_11366 [Cooperia oncophora]